MTVTACFTPQTEADIARASQMFIGGEWVPARYLETKTVVVAL